MKWNLNEIQMKFKGNKIKLVDIISQQCVDCKRVHQTFCCLPFIKCNTEFVSLSVALDFTSTLKCVFLFYSKYTTAHTICLWSNGHMLCVVRAYFTIETKFSVLSNEYQ